MGLPLRDAIYTTKMETHSIMSCQIWKQKKDFPTYPGIKKNGTRETSLKQNNIWMKSDLLLKNGTKVKKVMSGIKNMVSRLCRIGKPEHLSVSNAENIILLKLSEEVNSVPTVVNQNGEEIRESTMKQGCVLSAVKHLKRISTAILCFVSGLVQKESIEPVYNIMVEGQHEYFANGVLVSNCMDAIRYATYTHSLSYMQKVNIRVI
jgi:hypothetical protein